MFVVVGALVKLGFVEANKYAIEVRYVTLTHPTLAEKNTQLT